MKKVQQAEGKLWHLGDQPRALIDPPADEVAIERSMAAFRQQSPFHETNTRKMLQQSGGKWVQAGQALPTLAYSWLSGPTLAKQRWWPDTHSN